ncbi:MAG: hypothetical protein CL663_05250 [Bacteroidetes bacterium]|nr:hypothetical protein [Bacteroidota bacterium]
MRKTIISFVILILTSTGVYSQSLEAGVMAGGMYYLGDINTKSHFSEVGGTAGVVARYNIDKRWAFRFNALFGTISGDDLKSMEVENRNLNFRTPIYEFAIMGEFNFWSYETGSSENITPFIYAGISVSYYQPQARIAPDTYISLREIGTEGQIIGYAGRTMYDKSTIAIPFGIGAKYSLTNKIGLTVEWGMRKTFTDYLDDISTTYFLDGPTEPTSLRLQLSDPLENHLAGMERGNPDTKDWYSFFGISLTYKFNLNSENCAEF